MAVITSFHVEDEHLLQSVGDAFGPCLSKQFQNPIYTFKSFAEFQPGNTHCSSYQ